MTRLEESDIADEVMVSERELVSVGTLGAPYRTSPITSVVSGVISVNVAIPIEGYDDPVAPGDLFVLTGATAGNGTYTVLAVTGLTLTVVEAIPDSTGGSGDFLFTPGAKTVGVDSSAFSHSASGNAQDVLEDLDAAITAGGITPPQHKALRDLIHFIDDGPADGFASGAYKESVYTGAFPTNETWWESLSKTQKIVQLDTTYAGAFPTTEVWQMFDTDGTTVLVTLTDTITYSGAFEDTRTRTWA